MVQTGWRSVGVLFVVLGVGSITIDSRAEETTELPTVSLVGFRQLDPDLLIEKEVGIDNRDHVAGIPVEVFLAGVKSSESVRTALKEAGKDEATAKLGDWFVAAQTVAASPLFQKGHAQRPTHEIPILSPVSGETTFADPSLLIGLTGSELFRGNIDDKFTVVRIAANGKTIDTIRVDPKVTSIVKGAYSHIKRTPEGNASDSLTGLYLCSGGLNAKPMISRLVKFKAGEISFGMPRAFHADKKKIEVPKAVGEKGSVFWIDFSFTVRQINPKDIEQLTFAVEMLPSSATALVLIPDFQKTLKPHSDPKVQIPTDEQIRSDSRFKNLKSSIIPGGLHENSVFWTIRLDAIEIGSYKFTAVVLVPPEFESLDLALSVVARTKENFFAFGRNIAIERPVTLKLLLRDPQ